MKKLLMSLALLVSTIGHAQAQAPNLAYSKLIIDRSTAVYNNPTNEFIFPSVIRAADHIPNPLGTYYLYYAPHDAPAGINLAYSNSINGPFTEYPGNPIVSNSHQGEFNVTHVSSPHVIWMPQYNKYFMYFHGENTTTRWAHSTDGIHWELADNNIALTSAMWGSNHTETSYARVFEYTIPRFGDRYTMLMMTLRPNSGRHIGLATSNDGKHFTPRDAQFIAPGVGEGGQVSGPFYWQRDGRHYVLYHSASGNIHYTEVGANFDQDIRRGVFYNPQAHHPEYDKAADAFLIHADNRWNMFFTVGKRLEQSIAYAFEVPGNNIVIDNTDSGFSYGGSWVTSTSTKSYHGSNYLHDNNSGVSAGDWAKWKPSFPSAGYYKVMVRWPAANNRPDNIKYKVYHQGSVTEVHKNQTTDNGSWVYLGRYYFDAGNSEANRLTVDAGSDSGYTIADAAWFIRD